MMPQSANSAPPPRKKTGLIIGIVAAALFLIVALLVVVGLIAFFVLRGGSGGDGPIGGGDKPASPQEQATSLVTEYMDALVAGDSATALELSPIDMEGYAVLPAEAYDAALAAAPIADVVIDAPVIEESGYTGTVAVTATVGGEPASFEFDVSDYDSDDVMEMQAPFWSARAPSSLNGLGATINGAELPAEESLMVLPGAYEIALGVENFAPTSTDPLLFIDEESRPEWPEATLTDEGLKVFRGAVQAAVDECLAQKTLKAGCGIGEIPETTSDGWKVADGTVKRVLPEESQRTIDKMTATPSYDEPTYVEGQHIGSLDTTMECSKDGQKGTCEMWMGGGLGTPKVDMADPELPVTWS